MTPGLNGRGLLNLHFSNCTVHFGKPNSPGRLHWGNEPTHWMPQSQQIKRKKQSQITLFSNGGVQKSIARQCLRYLSLLTFSFGPRKNAQALDSVVYSLAFTFCARSQALVCSLTCKAPSTRIRIFLNPQFSFSVHSSSDSLQIYYFPLWRAN